MRTKRSNLVESLHRQLVLLQVEKVVSTLLPETRFNILLNIAKIWREGLGAGDA
jgi:hypothetical protein